MPQSTPVSQSVVEFTELMLDLAAALLIDKASGEILAISTIARPEAERLLDLAAASYRAAMQADEARATAVAVLRGGTAPRRTRRLLRQVA